MSSARSSRAKLDGAVDVFVVANPCFGLDVKAVAEIRARIVAARNAGAAVLLVSEDLDEIRELSDRILVMRDGEIVFEGARRDSRKRHRQPYGRPRLIHARRRRGNYVARFSRSVEPLYLSRNRPRRRSSGTRKSTTLMRSRGVDCG